jgi:predicted DNA-binding ribbon-helix-helix protein
LSGRLSWAAAEPVAMPHLRKPTKPRKQTFSRDNRTSTSVSLEDAFWDALTEIAREEGVSRIALIRRIDHDRVHSNFTSTIRVFVLEHFVAKYRSMTTNADRQQIARAEEGGLSR